MTDTQPASGPVLWVRVRVRVRQVFLAGLGKNSVHIPCRSLQFWMAFEKCSQLLYDVTLTIRLLPELLRFEISIGWSTQKSWLKPRGDNATGS